MLRISTIHDGLVRYVDFPLSSVDAGASSACGIHLPFPGISRRHARVEPLADGVRLIDLDSKNGLRQNGRRLPEVVLRVGESVQLGRARLRLERVDTSDVVLAETSGVGAARRSHHSAPNTDTVASDGLESTPGEAMRLVREIELLGGIPEQANGLLERATRVLGASSLFVFNASPAGVYLLRLVGATPSSDVLDASARAAHGTMEDGHVSTFVEPSTAILTARVQAEPLIAVAAVLESESSSVRHWRRDLFEFVALRLRPSKRREPVRIEPARVDLVLPDGFVTGRAPATIALLDQLRAAARSPLDVLILGATGAGKEYVARIIHDSGRTARGPFVAINCAAIPAELLEAELFGVKARVATGVDPRPGLLTSAQGGTVLLDEIGDMPEALQAKLLRALQEREVMPIGALRPEPIQVRVLSSTNRELPALVREGRFRADLYFRLRGLEVHVPPLRDRIPDIGVLAMAFADRAAQAHGKEILGLSKKALGLLQSHDWPGNIRELRSEIERAVLMCPDGGTLSSRYFESLIPRNSRSAASAPEPARVDEPSAPVQADVPGKIARPTLAQQVDALETRAIQEAMERAHGNQSRAARALGITRNGLALKMKRLGITRAERRSAD